MEDEPGLVFGANSIGVTHSPSSEVIASLMLELKDEPPFVERPKFPF